MRAIPFIAAKYATTPDRGINFSGTGRVYVWKQDDAGQWRQVEEIFDPVNVDFDLFGSSLSCSGDDLVVGAGGITLNGNKGEGAVYTIAPGGDLLLKQHPLTPSVNAGSNLTYGFTVTNQDAATATNVVLTAKLVKPPPPPQPVQPADTTTSTAADLTVQAPDDYLFDGVSFVSGNGATCSAKSGIITCDLGDIPPGVTLQPSITMHFADTAAGNPLNIAIVRSDQENVVTPQTRAVSSVQVKASTPAPPPPSADKSGSGGGGLGPLVLFFLLLVPRLSRVRPRR